MAETEIMQDHCKDCKFAFHPVDTPGSIICRRFPPMIYVAQNKHHVAFPSLNANIGWCGEFKRKIIQ